MFEKFIFEKKQVKNYHATAIRDFDIAKQTNIPEVIFKFSYDAILKLAITFCAKNDLRVKSKQGHHVELINKLSEFLNDNEIKIIGNEMRTKRNIDLYTGGTLITKKEANEYLDWATELFNKSKNILT